MRFDPTAIDGAWIIKYEPLRDDRGAFVRTFDEKLFAEHGLVTRFPEHSEAWNDRPGTVRGMHYQVAPHEEAKTIRVLKGAIYDVLLDLRSGPGYGRWIAVELRAGDSRALYCPAGVAHGYQTLEPDTHVAYAISTGYAPDSARGLHWQSLVPAVPWPLPVSAISERDAAYTPFDCAR